MAFKVFTGGIVEIALALDFIRRKSYCGRVSSAHFRTYLDRDLRYSLSLRQIVDNHRVDLAVAVGAAK